MYSHNDNQQRLNFDTISRADRHRPSNPPEFMEEVKDMRCPYCLLVVTRDGKACPECRQANIDLRGEE